jgi:hypothetical protein
VKVALSAPEPIGINHQIGDFTSGVVSLDEWLKRRALANQASGAARTFVVCEADKVTQTRDRPSGRLCSHPIRLHEEIGWDFPACIDFLDHLKG